MGKITVLIPHEIIGSTLRCAQICDAFINYGLDESFTKFKNWIMYPENGTIPKDIYSKLEKILTELNDSDNLLVTVDIFVIISLRILIKEGKINCNDVAWLHTNKKDNDITWHIMSIDKDGRYNASIGRPDSMPDSVYSDLLFELL